MFHFREVNAMVINAMVICQRLNWLGCALMGLMLLVGCEVEKGANPKATENKTQTDPAGSSTTNTTPDNGTAHSNTTASQVAEPGVGKKGKGYGGGMITEPASQYWQIKEKLAFSLMQKNMDLYKATNGFYPKSHEEFMQKIIDEGAITLPELPEGLKYQYDVQESTLMVVNE
jgi:hypothetical protein